MLRDGDEKVICQSFDDSWGYPANRLFRLPNWDLCNQVHPAIYRSPWMIQRPIYLRLLRPVLDRLNRGDTLYIHNRPECAEVLAEITEQRGIRLVLHMHNSLLHPRSRKHIPALKHVPVVFCSEFLRTEVTSAYPGHFQKTYVVYNGADGTKFRAETRKRKPVPQIIFTGRLVPYKGVHVLLAAMDILQRRGVKAKCTIVGGSAFGGSRPTRYVHKLEASNGRAILSLSAIALVLSLRIYSVMQISSVALPSGTTLFPMAVLEAMASGLPVVASEAGGIPEQLAHGGGVTVPPNDEEALATELQRLLDDESYRQRLGGEALTASRDYFLWDSVQRQYQSFVRGLAS